MLKILMGPDDKLEDAVAAAHLAGISAIKLETGCYDFSLRSRLPDGIRLEAAEPPAS